MDNYLYCAQFATAAKGRILDFGCGAGQTVGILREMGKDAFGCDTFYEGGDYSSDIPAGLRQYVLRMDGNAIPFPDQSFDLVMSNMVMEHVENLDAVIAEIHRVLVPGGIVLSLFPDRSVWIEGHCRIPFLHRFPKGSSLRVYYAAALSWMGVGARDRTKEKPLPWAHRICSWLDHWTHYRSISDIHKKFGRHFSGLQHIEDQWLAARFGRKPLPRFLQRYLVRRIGAAAFTCTRPA